MAQGAKPDRFVGFNGCYGYDYYAGDKSITVKEEEARGVHMVYDMYLEGCGTAYFRNASTFCLHFLFLPSPFFFSKKFRYPILSMPLLFAGIFDIGIALFDGTCPFGAFGGIYECT